MRRWIIGNFGFIFPLLLLLPTTHSKTNLIGDDDACSKVEIVPRAEWRPRPPLRQWSMKLPVNDVIIHHTVTPPCRTKPQCLRNINLNMWEYHVDTLGWPDIGYNFLVGGDGRIYEGVGWTRVGSHTINYNSRSVGVAFIGDYRTVAPSQKMIDAALGLIECGVQKGYLTPIRQIHGHRDMACSESPGDKLYEIIRTWDNYKGGKLKLYHCGPNPHDIDLK